MRYRTWASRSYRTEAFLLLALVGVFFPASQFHPLQAKTRSAWVVEQITEHNAAMNAARRADKYALMGDSITNFYRATNYLFWADHANSPLLGTFGGVKETRTWLHGDCHVENIGAISNSMGQVVYDLDDFDDSVIGDYQLDLWRLAISLVLLLRENHGFSPKDEESLLNAFSSSYLTMMSIYRHNNAEKTRVFTADNTPNPLSDFLTETEQTTSRLRMLEKLTSKGNGRRIFDFYHPDILPVPPSIVASIASALPSYIGTLPTHLRNHPDYFRIKSVALRLRGGMGSLGVARYYVLIEGPTAGEDDDRILDIKTQTEPYPWPYIDLSVRNQLLAACNGNHALRTVLAARALGYRTDEFLGTVTLFGTAFSVRERTPARGTLDIRELSTPSRVSKLAEVWGAVLATAHARADRDANATLLPQNFEEELLGRIGDRQDLFRGRVRQVALSYANQVAADHAAFNRTLLHRQTASRE